MSVVASAVNGLRRARSSGCWKPASFAYLTRSMRPPSGPLQSDDAALRGAAAWLARAQDAAPDGGISGRFRLHGGWSSSYPETTGYAIPTLLRLADALNDDSYRERAQRCVDFLLSVQLPDGAFPALEIADNRTKPSPFNSAQIVHGLLHWHKATRDGKAFDAMIRAAHWICGVQDADGAWRAHFYRGLACTYSAHAACWLAELGEYTGDSTFDACAQRNLRWVVDQLDAATGWFDACGFTEAQHHSREAFTHTIGYTLAGVWRMSQRFQCAEGIDAVRTAAEALTHRIERSRRLAAVLDHQWRPRTSYVCLTGNAQIAELLLQVAGANNDWRLANAAFKAIDDVKRAQVLDSGDAGILGGIPGSWPVSGDYIPFALPNWAPKFFIDALLAKRRWLQRPLPFAPDLAPVVNAPSSSVIVPPPPAPTLVVYTTRISPMFASLARALAGEGVAPAHVVIETDRSRLTSALAAFRHPDDDSATICRRLGWPSTFVRSINGPDAVALVKRLASDVAISAGAGILRTAILSAPRRGTLGVHMGLLPRYRGMNVAEWSALYGDRAGCTVFWIDEGIDSGAIAASEAVDVSACRTVAELRACVNERQLALLSTTARAALAGDVRAPSGAHAGGDGRQFYRMHPDIAALLERRLSEKAALA